MGLARIFASRFGWTIMPFGITAAMKITLIPKRGNFQISFDCLVRHVPVEPRCVTCGSRLDHTEPIELGFGGSSPHLDGIM